MTKISLAAFGVVIGILLTLLAAHIAAWFGSWETSREAYDRGYNEGYDAGYSEALKPWLEIQPAIQWHSTEMFLIEDVDKYVAERAWHPPLVWPIHRVRKPWISDGELFLSDNGDSVLLRYDTLGWEDWSDDDSGWHSITLSPALIQNWYDRAADTTHKVYEAAFTNLALSVLLRERTLVIYFDSTDTMYGPPYPWFWSDSAVANDEHWIALSFNILADSFAKRSSGFVLRDSLLESLILRHENPVREQRTGHQR